MMTTAAIWFAAGLIVAAAELLAPGFFLLWIGLAACAAGALDAALGLSWEGQLLAFAIFAAALVGLAGWRLRRQPPRPDLVNAAAAGLIGTSCRAIAFEAGEGRVSIRDSTWPARVADHSTPTAGELLRVVGLDGNTLLVTRG